MLNIEKCTGCGACENVCPKNAIKLLPNHEGFLYPQIDTEKCIECRLCEKACIIMNPLPSSKPRMSFCCYNTNTNIRISSSSGGIFYLLAKSVIDKGGVVFGAVFDENFNVVHTYADSIIKLQPMLGSKYVQSSMDDSFCKVKDFLTKGRLVYFSGTPCQIAGLKAFLGKDYKNLICQDLLCHGVPSPKVWQSYVDIRLKKSNSALQRIAFRAKPWKRFSVSFLYENNTEYRCVFMNDTYMKLFLNNTILRRSCYDCPAKGCSGADITLGDYWGVENIHPEMDDDQGTSLVILNSPKGVSVFSEITDNLKSVQTITPTKGMYWCSVKIPRNRNRFFTEYGAAHDDKTVEKVFLRYAKLSKLEKLKNMIKRMLPKVLINIIRKKILN